MNGYTFDRRARHMREYLSVLLPLLDGTAVSVDGSTLSAHIGLSVPRAGQVPVLLAALARGYLPRPATRPTARCCG